MLIPLCLCVLCPSFIQCFKNVHVQLLSWSLCFKDSFWFVCCRSWRIYWRNMKPTLRPGRRRRTSTKKWLRYVSQFVSQPVSQSSHSHSIVTCDRFHMMSLSNVAGITWCHCHNTCITRCFLYSNISTLNKMYRFFTQFRSNPCYYYVHHMTITGK